MELKDYETLLSYYRSELKMKGIKKYKFIGIVTELILSFEIFKRNEEVSIFLKEILNIEFKDYVYKSRTNMAARTAREIYDYDDEQLDVARKQINKFVNLLVRQPTLKNSHTLDKDKMIKWLRGISR